VVGKLVKRVQMLKLDVGNQCEETMSSMNIVTNFITGTVIFV